MNNFALIALNARKHRDLCLREMKKMAPDGIPNPSDYNRFRALKEDYEWYDEVLENYPKTGLLPRRF